MGNQHVDSFKTVRKMVRSLFFYFVLVVSTIFLGTACILCAVVTRKEKWCHGFGRLWGAINLWAAGVRVSVKGLDHVDARGSYIFAANHQGLFDILAVLAKLPIQFSWLAKEELFRLPVFGRAMRVSGYIPIDRSDHRKALESMNRAADRVRGGTSVVIFPEGTRSLDGVLQEFKKGGFMLAIKSQCPVVPMSISGSYRILPKRSKWLNTPGCIAITFGSPISTEGLTVKDRDRLLQEVREAVRANLTVREGGLLSEPECGSPPGRAAIYQSVL
ncbi:MAG: 1-acyl-sn-glycerol-3-phosphate acyltransferase [Deltaproteobacteria bacterium]|nr:1-acyl-sn-glycerol-3-phosphate acyltransferase [Deltaproteobacteria bacterium]